MESPTDKLDLPHGNEADLRRRCGVARALDLVGERWALLVVRELLLGPKRFTDLRAGLPHVSADVLTQRLKELERAGVVRRGTLPPPAGSRIYELTERGRELEPIVIALGRWGSVAPFPPGDAQIGDDAFVIALKSLFDPAAADGVDARYELRLGEQRFRVHVAEGRLEVARGAADGPTRRSRPTRARSRPCCGTAARPATIRQRQAGEALPSLSGSNASSRRRGARSRSPATAAVRSGDVELPRLAFTGGQQAHVPHAEVGQDLRGDPVLPALGGHLGIQPAGARRHLTCTWSSRSPRPSGWRT